ELRIRNEPAIDPERRVPFSSRNLVACLREGAERFGWAGRAPSREGDWLVGMGVAASTYPSYWMPSQATVREEEDGSFLVRIGATDVGTGGRTALTQLAAEELGVPLERVRVEIGDTTQPYASLAGGSSGTASWGSAIAKACRALRANGGTEASANTEEDVK